jgi:hypothetical protein
VLLLSVLLKSSGEDLFSPDAASSLQRPPRLQRTGLAGREPERWMAGAGAEWWLNVCRDQRSLLGAGPMLRAICVLCEPMVGAVPGAEGVQCVSSAACALCSSMCGAVCRE